MEAAVSLKISLHIYQTARCHIPEVTFIATAVRAPNSTGRWIFSLRWNETYTYNWSFRLLRVERNSYRFLPLDMFRAAPRWCPKSAKANRNCSVSLGTNGLWGANACAQKRSTASDQDDTTRQHQKDTVCTFQLCTSYAVMTAPSGSKPVRFLRYPLLLFWIKCEFHYKFFPPWRNSPQWAEASSLSTLHDHTQTHHTR